MPLLSAIDDFMLRSLSALPTVWQKLRFVSSLREEGSGYRHWGLEQKYGQKEAQEAIAEAHSALFNESASTPLSELWLAADQAARGEELETADYLRKLTAVKSTLPNDLHGVAPEHFSFVVTNLYRIARSRSASNRLAA